MTSTSHTGMPVSTYHYCNSWPQPDTAADAVSALQSGYDNQQQQVQFFSLLTRNPKTCAPTLISTTFAFKNVLHILKDVNSAKCTAATKPSYGETF